MARKRPAASQVTQPELDCVDGDRPCVDGPLLKRAEVTALRRSAPLTHAKLTEIFRRHMQHSASDGHGRNAPAAAGKDAA